MFGLVLAANCFSQIKEVTLTDTDDDKGKNGVQRNVIPTVKYDDRTVWITSDNVLPGAGVVIKDVANKVVYRATLPLSPLPNAIQLPAGTAKLSIEVTTEDDRFVGYFDEE